jgi:hypothetical protein
MNRDDLVSLLSAAVGRTIVAIRRTLYVKPNGAVDDRGPIQVSFDDGRILLFEVGRLGEELAIETGPWIDPFAEPLTDENRSYVQLVGKWTDFEVSKGLLVN